MTHRTEGIKVIRDSLLVIESPSLIRMYLMGKITFEQAFGIEEFIRAKNQIPYEPKVIRIGRMFGDLNRTRRDLISREGRNAEEILNRFVNNPYMEFWTVYDKEYGKRKGWMKELILFAGEKLDHVHVYFTENGEET